MVAIVIIGCIVSIICSIFSAYIVKDSLRTNAKITENLTTMLTKFHDGIAKLGSISESSGKHLREVVEKIDEVKEIFRNITEIVEKHEILVTDLHKSTDIMLKGLEAMFVESQEELAKRTREQVTEISKQMNEILEKIKAEIEKIPESNADFQNLQDVRKLLKDPNMKKMIIKDEKLFESLKRLTEKT